MIYDITNPNASYNWLYKVLNIKKGSFIKEYCLSCNSDLDLFSKKYMTEINNIDLEKMEFMVFHVTTNDDECDEIKKFGLCDLKWVLKNNTKLNSFLIKHGIRFDIDARKMYVDNKEYSVDYEKYRYMDGLLKEEKALHNIGHKLYYDYQINSFLFCEDIYKYGVIHRAPEFLYTISAFNDRTYGLDLQWEKSCKPYVVQYKARFIDFAYFTFYGTTEDYLNDYHNNWIKLKRLLISRAVESSFGNSAYEIYVYMKPSTVINPNSILRCVQADEWRKR